MQRRMETDIIVDFQKLQDNHDSDSVVPDIIHILSQLVLFSIGTFIQVKTILICKKEKQIPWELHITNSVILIIYFSFSICFYTSTHFIPLLPIYFGGNWVCYVAALITYYCHYAIVAHTLVISMVKYVYIVHPNQILSLDETNARRLFFVCNLIHPLLLTISNIAASDWGSNSALNSCFEYNMSNNSTKTDDIQKPFLCILNLSKHGEYDVNDLETSYSTWKGVLCLWRSSANVILNSNLVEAWFYFRIFRKMKM